ncbi:MAG: hypothetical protein CMO30_08850 [Tistrella sp.]|nr:hypothetical protein [Tistrella sp.]MBA75375.1 hypothetical protein [Tistrella sp.]|tara:strand:- start:4913 stop:5143 length:231 start_codon:yes stop_codon:yes gene_type:complete
MKKGRKAYMAQSFATLLQGAAVVFVIGGIADIVQGAPGWMPLAKVAGGIAAYLALLAAKVLVFDWEERVLRHQHRS